MSKNDVGVDKSEDKGEDKMKNFSDRYYRTLYELLLKVHMSKATSLDEYFGLVFKSIKSDLSVPRCAAFIKRLLQMAFVNEGNFIAASLLIISEIIKVR
jgi:ribosome biogenesis protein MAK21